MNKTEKEINTLFMAAHALALKEVERLARAVLLQNPSLDKFVMAMGHWFFTFKNNPNDNISSHNRRKYTAKIEAFINEWDPYLHLTGEGVRFTATGPVDTDW